MNSIEWQGRKIKLGKKYGGVGWPGETGWGVVVAKELYPIVGTNQYRIFVLADVEERSTNQLLTRCAELKERFDVSEFCGRYDKNFMETVDLWNAEQRQFPQMYIYSAANSEDGHLAYHLDILESRLRKGQKTLFFSDDSKLPEEIDAVPPWIISTATDTQFPAVAALGYAVAAAIWDPAEIEQDKPEPPDDVNPRTGY